VSPDNNNSSVMTVAGALVTVSAPMAVISVPTHNETWWANEAAHTEATGKALLRPIALALLGLVERGASR
jgi:hypothetical protein